MFDHKSEMMQGDASTSKTGIGQNEIVAIPRENERIDVKITSIFVVGKSEERITINGKGLHVVGSIRLKRLQFYKAPR